MKIYIAAPMIHCIENKMEGQLPNVLLSYWDWIGPIPFRKPTFKYLIPILTLLKEKLNDKNKKTTKK